MTALAVLLLCSAADLWVPPADTLVADTAREQAARRVLEAYARPLDPDWGATTRQLAWIDLNGDERVDAVAYLSGAAWCGSSGCTFVVLEALDDLDAAELGPYVPAAEISQVHGQVYAAGTGPDGWRDLVATDAQGDWRLLRFDGETYPFSPSDGMPLDDLPDGAVPLFPGGLP